MGIGYEGLIWKIYRIAESIARILYINLLWVAFSLLGVIVLGFFPATAAMFSVVRKSMLGEKDIPIFKTFWQYYKTEFIQSNLLGLALVLIGAVLYVDLRFFQSSDSIITLALSYLFLFLLLVYFAVVLYIFPVFVHYQFKTLEYIKYALIMAVGRPFQTLFMIVGCLLVLTLLRMVPMLMLYFGGSLLCYVLMWKSIKSFPKEEIQE
ncbi:YesL family protein [Fredinandcohnia sp. FSL W7-1320]|uniref:YesL family protein n=1 Tax=Fredinandcohnia sp. FSL W7-1320 TaxID=2954540 RepID=UPI0030FDEBAE